MERYRLPAPPDCQDVDVALVAVRLCTSNVGHNGRLPWLLSGLSFKVRLDVDVQRRSVNC